MSTTHDKLMMFVGLTDQVTKPLRGISNQMQQTMDVGRQGMSNIVSGGAGLVASGLAIQNALMPAIEMDRKMGEVASLGVTDDALKQLQNTALEFSAEYGKSATEFVSSSYKIKSAISSLDGSELAHFTRTSGVLAAATKASNEEITGYMGQMYKIFSSDVAALGNEKWVDKVAGQTAAVVQMFNTEGKEMAAAFQTLQSAGSANNINMEEQFAVLGTLQAITKSGARAGTQYSAFLQGVGKAQEALGNSVSFSENDGSMKSVLDIMSQIKGMYGDTLDASEQLEISKSFGGKQALNFIMNMMNETDGLAKSIEQLGEVKNLDTAELMASKMTDQWERMESTFFAVRAAVFGAILPSINSVVGVMSDGLMVVVGWVQEFPILGDILGWVGIGMASLTGIIGALTLASGIATIATSSLGTTIAALFWPVTLVVGAIAGVVIAVWKYWDTISAFVGGFVTAFVEASGVAALFNPLISAFGIIGDLVSWVFGWVSSFLPAMNATGEALDKAANAGGLFGSVLGAAFGAVIAPIKMVLSAIDWLLEKLNLIPGVSIDVGAKFSDIEKMTGNMDLNSTKGGWSGAFQENEQNGTGMFAYKQAQNKTGLPSGMVANATTVNKQQAGNNRTYGNVTINSTQPMTPDILAEWDEMNAG